MTKVISDFDQAIINDMNAYIVTINKAIEGHDDRASVRPMIGDARFQPVSFWKNEIAKNNRWIEQIKAQYA